MKKILKIFIIIIWILIFNNIFASKNDKIFYLLNQILNSNVSKIKEECGTLDSLTNNINSLKTNEVPYDSLFFEVIKKLEEDTAYSRCFLRFSVILKLKNTNNIEMSEWLSEIIAKLAFKNSKDFLDILLNLKKEEKDKIIDCLFWLNEWNKMDEFINNLKYIENNKYIKIKKYIYLKIN